MVMHADAGLGLLATALAIAGANASPTLLLADGHISRRVRMPKLRTST
jgi:hypothetical protein